MLFLYYLNFIDHYKIVSDKLLFLFSKRKLANYYYKEKNLLVSKMKNMYNV